MDLERMVKPLWIRNESGAAIGPERAD
jgi:hypothetical protein